MRLPPFRFRLRTLVLAIAILALLLAAEATRRRWAAFRVMAKQMILYESQCRTMEASFQLTATKTSGDAQRDAREKEAEYRRLAEECVRMRRELESRW